MRQKSASFFFLFLLVCGWSVLTGISVHAQITWDKPKTEPPLDNPYTIGATREQILKTTSEVLKTCAIPVDDTLTRTTDGRIVTKYEIFSKGITVRADLEHVSNPPASETRNWTKARYYLEIIALPLDEKKSQLQVIAHIQGLVNDFSGSKWIDVPSNGRLEDDVLRGLASKVLGIDLSVKTSSGRSGRRIFNCEY
ncbi:MAG: hypothetical protein U0Z53_31645 [Blastocatellia bacterium]